MGAILSFLLTGFCVFLGHSQPFVEGWNNIDKLESISSSKKEISSKNRSAFAVLILGDLSKEEVIFRLETFPEDSNGFQDTAMSEKDRLVFVAMNYSSPSIPFFDKDQEPWVQQLFKSLLVKRLENNSSQLKVLWKKEMSPTPVFSPEHSLHAVTSEEQFTQGVDALFGELEKIKEQGFLREEFTRCKEKWQQKLVRLASVSEGSYSEESSFPFLQVSLDGLEKVSYETFSFYTASFLAEENCAIHVSSLPYDIEEISKEVLLEKTENVLIPQICAAHLSGKNPSPWTQPRNAVFSQPLVMNTTAGSIGQSLSDLPITEKDKENIEYIIGTMAKKNELQLLFKKSKMEKKGEKIQHVHPLRFLEYVFNTPDLKQAMRKVFKNYFKRNGFLNGHGSMEGFATKMKNEGHRGNLAPYIPEFAKSLNVSPDKVMAYIKDRDYEGLVKFLIHS